MKTRYEPINLHLFETEALCMYLHEMAKKGWMIQKIYLNALKFRKCDPTDLQFVIDLYHKGSYINPYCTDDGQLRYVEFVEEYGYEEVCRTSNFSLYQLHGEAIEIGAASDEEYQSSLFKTMLKFESINYLLPGIAFLVLAFLQLQSFSLYNIQTNDSLIGGCAMLVLQVLFVIRMIPCLIWLNQRKQRGSVKGILMRDRIFYGIWYFILLVCIIGVVFQMKDTRTILIPLIIAVLCIPFFLLLDKAVAKKLKKFHALVSIVIVIAALLSTFNMFILHNIASSAQADHTYSTFVAGPIDFTEYRDDLQPLRESKNETKESILLKTETYTYYYGPGTHISLPEGGYTVDQTYLSYSLYTIKADWIKSFVYGELLDRFHAEKVKEAADWQYYTVNDSRSILFKGNRILEIDLAELSDAQVETLIKLL